MNGIRDYISLAGEGAGVGIENGLLCGPPPARTINQGVKMTMPSVARRQASISSTPGRPISPFCSPFRARSNLQFRAGLSRLGGQGNHVLPTRFCKLGRENVRFGRQDAAHSITFSIPIDHFGPPGSRFCPRKSSLTTPPSAPSPPLHSSY